MNEKLEPRLYREVAAPKIETALRRYLPAAPPQIEKQFNEVLETVVFSGGERLHGLLTLLSAEMFGGRGENILPAAAASEYVHCAAQIFAGLSKTNEDIKFFAVLGLLNTSYGLMFANTNIYAERAAQAHNELVECIGSGELFSSGAEPGPALYSGPAEISAEIPASIPAAKTAISMRLAVRIGAALAGADHLQLEALSRFGGFFGEACRLKSELSELKAGTENLTAELERAQLVHRLSVLIDEAKRILATHFSENETAGILLELTESLAA